MALDIVAWHDRSASDHLTQYNNARIAGYSTVSLCIYGDAGDPRPFCTLGYGESNLKNSGGGGRLSAAATDVARVLAALSVTFKNPMMSTAMIQT